MGAAHTPQGSFVGSGRQPADSTRIHRINILRAKAFRKDRIFYGYAARYPKAARPFVPKQTRMALAEVVRTYKLDDDTSTLRESLDTFVGKADAVLDRLLSNELDDAELFRCPHCGTVESRDGSNGVHGQNETWCRTCLEDDAVYVDHINDYAAAEVTVYSEYMQEHILEADSIGIYTTNVAVNDRTPDDYATRRYAQNNLTYSETLEGYYDAENVDDPDDEDEDSGIIQDYHSSQHAGNQERLDSRADDRLLAAYVGCEIEVEVGSGYAPRDCAERLNNALNIGRRYAHFEEDGSLDRGFEIVTNYCGWDRHETELAPLKNLSLLRGLTSHDTETCGLHVHLSKQDITPFQATKIDQFFADPGNISSRDRFARRTVSGSEYLTTINPKDLRERHPSFDRARGLAEKKLYAMTQRQSQGNHYHIVNWSPNNTVEFRLFRGTLRYETLIATLQFVQGMFWFTRECAPSAMNWPSLIAWARKPENIGDMRYFLRYCTERKITAAHEIDQEPRQANQFTKELTCA